MKYRRTIVVGGTPNQAIAKTALATSDALNMDLRKTDPSVDIPLNKYSLRPNLPFASLHLPANFAPASSLSVAPDIDNPVNR
jgi:hypothetical protein